MTEAMAPARRTDRGQQDLLGAPRCGRRLGRHRPDDRAAASSSSLIGPSGCGKSTLLRVIADLLPADARRVQVNGKTARRARLDQDYGFAFQQAGLLDWRTVQANIELPLELHGVDRAERKARARELLDLVGLADFASTVRRSCPAACSSGSRSPARWPRARPCC